jgi:transcriptional regulator with XRE-family HTH domain
MEDWKQRLRTARLAKGLNKTEFARLVPVSNPTVTDWEKSVEDGGIGEITGPKLMRVCEVLEVDPEWLLKGREAKNKDAGGGLADSLDFRVRDAEELRVLLIFRMARESDPVARSAIDAGVNVAEKMLDAAGRRLNKLQS